MKQFMIIAFAAIFLLGCGATPGLEKDATPGQRLLGLEVQYGTVFSLMAEYEGLKRCGVTTSKVCSEQTVVNKMRSAHTAIITSMDTAWTVIRSAGANASTKEYAVATVEGLIDNARELYDSVKNIIVEKRSI